MSNKLKIVYIIDELNIGGTEKQLLKTIEYIAKDKFDVSLICLRPSKYYYEIEIPCESYILNVYSLVSCNAFIKLLKFVFYLKKCKIDIVQTYFFDSSVFGVLSAKLAGVKKIISCKRDMGFWYTPNLLRVLKIINKFVDRFLVNSHAVKKHISKYESIPPQKIDVIYNGIDLEPFKKTFDTEAIKRELGISDDDRVVGIVANLNRPVKRVSLFIEAAYQVLKKNKHISFIIVGDGHLHKRLEQQAHDLEIDQNLHFVGSQNDVISYLQLYDIGVLTSESEGFANSILEYMAAGLPVICFDLGGNKELVEDGENGYLVKFPDHHEIARNILKSLQEKDLNSKMKKTNQEKVKDFSWEKISEKLTTYYDTITIEKKHEC